MLSLAVRSLLFHLQFRHSNLYKMCNFHTPSTLRHSQFRIIACPLTVFYLCNCCTRRPGAAAAPRLQLLSHPHDHPTSFVLLTEPPRLNLSPIDSGTACKLLHLHTVTFASPLYSIPCFQLSFVRHVPTVPRFAVALRHYFAARSTGQAHRPFCPLRSW